MLHTGELPSTRSTVTAKLFVQFRVRRSPRNMDGGQVTIQPKNNCTKSGYYKAMSITEIFE